MVEAALGQGACGRAGGGGARDGAAGRGTHDGPERGGAGERRRERVRDGGRRRREQLEVLAVAERVRDGVRAAGERGRDGDRGEVDVQVHAAFARQVPQFGGEAVRDVDAGVGAGFAQRAAGGEPRLEREVAPGRERVAERTGREEAVAGACAGAQQRAAARHGARAEDVQLERVAARGVAADERHAVFAGEGGEPVEDAVDARDRRVAGGDEVDERPARFGAHRGEVGEHAAERLAPDEPRVGLRQEVVAGWTASAFEFCTLEQYEKIKGQDQYYFLVIADAAGISYLNLHKGTFEVISLPLMAAEGGNGRELTYLGGLIKTVQEFTLEAMESEKVAYGMEAWVNKNYSKWGKAKEVLIASDDLPEGFTAEASYNGLRIVDTAEADQAYIDAAGATLVSYTVAPFTTEKGSYCYKMLFDAETHNLCYISKHKISAKKGEGFLPEDLKRLSKKK